VCLKLSEGIFQMMSKTEKRLCILAIVFVAVYLGAAALTLHRRFGGEEVAETRIESVVATKAESRLAMVELFLPMMVLLAITLSYMVVKKKRVRQISALEESDDDIDEAEYMVKPQANDQARIL
jgi:sensor domain CHASE-containing protein